MAKRELMLVGLFAVAGVVAWRLTAAPSKPGEEGFSLAHVLRHLRAGLSAQRAEYPVRFATTAPASGLRMIVGDDFTGDVTVTGEDRIDVAVELSGVAYGSDQAGAAARAAETRLEMERTGDGLRIVVRTPTVGRRPRLNLTIRAPRPVGVALRRARGSVDVSGLASVDVDTRHGDLRIADVTGTVRGEHRDGRLEVMRVGGVRLAMRDGNVRIERVAGAVELTAADSRLELRDVAGSTHLEIERADANLDRLRGKVRIDARDGRVTLHEQRQPVEYEGERAHFSVTLAAPVELRATSSDEAVEVTLAGNLGAALDLVAEDGNIRLPDRTIAVQQSDRTRKATGTLGGGGATVIVRTERADIEVRR